MISFSLPYPGAAASSNHGYHIVTVAGHARLALTEGAMAFKAEVIILAKQAISAAQWFPPVGTVLHVTITGCFPNKLHSDVGNIAKFVNDSVEEAMNSYVEGGPQYNDRDWGYTVMPPVYRPGEPMIEVKVE